MMKNVIIVFLLAFCSQFSFSQNVCGAKEMRAFIDKVDITCKQEDIILFAKLNKALEALCKVKKWDAKQRDAYTNKMGNTKEVLAYEKNKRNYIDKVLAVFYQADEKNETAGNCEKIKEMQEIYSLYMKENATEWKFILATISSEYKKSTKKELVIE